MKQIFYKDRDIRRKTKNLPAHFTFIILPHHLQIQIKFRSKVVFFSQHSIIKKLVFN